MQLDPVSEDLSTWTCRKSRWTSAIQVAVPLRHVGEARRGQGRQGHPRDDPARGAGVLPPGRPSRECSPPTSPTSASTTSSRWASSSAPEGVRILTDPGQAVATVAPPMAEEVVAAPAAPRWRPTAGRARGAHGAQAQGRSGDEKDKDDEEEVGGRRASSGSAIPARVPGHAAQRGAASRGRARPDAARALRARRADTAVARARWHGEPVYLIKPQSLHERERPGGGPPLPGGYTSGPPTSSWSSTTWTCRWGRCGSA